MIHPEFGPGRLSAEWLNSKSSENPWVLTTNDPDAEGHRSAFIGNGFIGQRIGIEGEGPGIIEQRDRRVGSGCLVHGLWNDRDLMPTPTWSGLAYDDGNCTFAKGSGTWKNYEQSLDLKTAILSTSVDWEASGRETKLQTEAFMSRTHPNVGVISRTITPSFNGEVSIIDELDGSFIDDARGWRVQGEEHAQGLASLCLVMGPRETRVTLLSRLVLEGIEEPAVSVEKAEKAVRRTLTFSVESGKSYKVTKIAAIVTANEVPSTWPYARCLAESMALDLERVRRDHMAAWAELWQNWIEVPHLRLQSTINASLYQLYSNLRAGGRWSLGPTGLSGNAWGGHAFWDSDLWMFPGLCLLNPELARGFVEYRVDTLPGSIRNAQAEGLDGAMIAWQSSEAGDDIVPHIEDHHQHHVNSDVALAQWWFAKVSGDEDYLREKAARIIIESAKFWVSRVTYNEDEDRYELLRIYCADEFARTRDNNTYTNYSAVRNIRLAQHMCRLLGEEPPAVWEEIATKMWLPFDEENQRYIEYDGYNGEVIKQADTALLVYPYEMPMPDNVKANIVDYYRTRYPEGNIMMAAAFDGIVDCELGRSETGWASYEKLMPHFREPFLLVSESPLNEIISFQTGLGGLLQLVLMGFAGIRIHKDGLQVQPCLPPVIGSMTIHGLHYSGQRFDLEIDGDTAKVQTNEKLDFKVYNAKGESWR